MPPQRTRALRPILALSLALLLGGALPGGPARAQEAGDSPPAGVSGPSGDEPARGADREDAQTGTVLGQVFDADTGQPLEGATVILEPPSPEVGRAPDPVMRVTDERGAYRIAGVPPGPYKVRFRKAGYRDSAMTDFEVVAGQVNRADFPLPPRAAETSGEILQLDEFVVEASTAEDAVVALEMRLESDQLLNVMSEEDLSKFAASDVAEALERVAGVNIAGGEFAVIRGLDDRYNSTLYNGAVVPSPDPDKQSVQLDLFPSDIVNNLVVSKTFGPDLPSNTSGGGIDILTLEFPEGFLELAAKAGTGWNTNADERFLRFEEGSPIGSETTDREDILESDFTGLLGGRLTLAEREVRFKGLWAREIDYETAEGFQEDRQPSLPQVGAGSRVFNPNFPDGPRFILVPGELEASGGLSLGELDLSGGRFDLTESSRDEQLTLYGSLGLDLDADANHRITGSAFFTRKEEEIVQLRDNGFLPGFDYEDALLRQLGPGLPEGNTAPFEPPFEGVATVDSFIAGILRDQVSPNPELGALAIGSFFRSQSFDRERELEIYQLNGDHRFDAIPELEIRWVVNRAETTQDDLSRGIQGFFEPSSAAVDAVVDEFLANGALDLQLPVAPGEVGDCPPDGTSCGFFATPNVTFSSNSIEETQDFARIDLEYETDVTDRMRFSVTGGWWRERADRSVTADFLIGPTNTAGASNQFVLPGPGVCGSGPEALPCVTSLQDLGPIVFDPDRGGLAVDSEGLLEGLSQTSNESSREIDAWHVGAKLTLWERLDLSGGIRIEDILIESNNDPFIPDDPATPFDESIRLGGPRTFPSRFLFFDRIDSPGEGIPAGTDASEITFNDEILGIDVPVEPDGTVNFSSRKALESVVNGRIDETKVLPSLGFNLRPREGLSLRGAWSKTEARPSFRELGFYVTVEPGTDDLTVGNPQVQLSSVESWDARVEYTWGEHGDLLAVSLFRKEIQDPIEQIVVRDPTNAEFGSSDALFRTFFNNPNEASLRGIEAEVRKSFAFVPRGLRWLGIEDPGLGVLQHLSIGGNFTYIDAEVDRTEAELERTKDLFGVAPGDEEEFSELEESRRLFNQPEWIANADLTFSHPDWGTRLTLAFFAISDVLDAAGTASLLANGDVLSFTPDRFVDSFHELRLTFSQRWQPSFVPGELTLSGSVKNLTDSERAIVFDPQQTVDEVEERAFKIGRDWSLSLRYTLRF